MDTSHSGDAGTVRTLTCSPSEIGPTEQAFNRQLLVRVTGL